MFNFLLIGQFLSLPSLLGATVDPAEFLLNSDKDTTFNDDGYGAQVSSYCELQIEQVSLTKLNGDSILRFSAQFISIIGFCPILFFGHV